jgi:alpha-mannosidase
MAQVQAVQKHWRATLERIEKFISDTYFTDVNLRGRLYPVRLPLPSVRWYNAGQRRISFQAAQQALSSTAEVATKDVSLGPTWSTHWFSVEVRVPDQWVGKEVRLRWDSGGEAMVWIQGEPLQGLTGSHNGHQIRTDFILTKSANPGDRFSVYIEAVASDMFGAGAKGMINPPDPSRYYSITMAELAVFDRDVYALLMDLTVIYDSAKHLPEGSERAYHALYTANNIVNACEPFKKSIFPLCRAIAREFLGERNGESQHTIHAMGHCHIDSAWLWPYSETIRKCGRSWSSVLRLMEEHPSFTFVCSQAQQFEWVKLNYPVLYERILLKAKSGQFIPVGGTWIEMDGNIPSGESFVRQFLLGQKFFKEEFGHYCNEFWLPDTFGYSAQLPQIMAGSGINYFLSQKLSWNLTNKFPHHTFLWEGIDGTCCLAHFPPADTYQSRADVKDVLKTVSQFRDKGRSRQSILLYGHGDGGGGPTEDMLQNLKRMEDVDGIPKVLMSSPQQFFSSITSEKDRLCKWVGELYLELHRGTYTTQAKLKLENRRGEFLLHDVDFMCAIDY